MLFRLLLASMFVLLAGPATAQEWPTRPVKFVISQPPGTSPDIVARFLADKLSRSLGQQVIVENRPGGQNVIGAQAVAKAPAPAVVAPTGSAAMKVVRPRSSSASPSAASPTMTGPIGSTS